MEEEHHVSFYPLLLVVLLAFLTPLLLGRLRHIRIPVVVGEILAGMIFGRSGLNIIQPDPWLELLATLGFAYLMFLSGLEIDVSALGAAPRHSWWSAAQYARQAGYRRRAHVCADARRRSQRRVRLDRRRPH